MKYVMALLTVTVLLLAGCEYESPLTKEHTIAVDSALLGLWEPVPDEGDEPKQDERMMILKYSDTEYLIHYPPRGNDEVYYRGYPIKIDGVSCVQLQIIGTDGGPLPKDEKDLFHVGSYQLANGVLEIKLLNTDLVNHDLKTTEALEQSFLKHKRSKNLFTNPGRFRRIKE